jgi:hypothetical protein
MKYKAAMVTVIAFVLLSLARPDKEFKIFQFPQNQIPRIDGEFSDWKMVPETYTIGIEELKNTKFGEGVAQDPKDFGDGESSEEQNPVHQYKQGKESIIILTVEGPAGKSVRSKVWDVVTKLN